MTEQEIAKSVESISRQYRIYIAVLRDALTDVKRQGFVLSKNTFVSILNDHVGYHFSAIQKEIVEAFSEISTDKIKNEAPSFVFSDEQERRLDEFIGNNIKTLRDNILGQMSSDSVKIEGVYHKMRLASTMAETDFNFDYLDRGGRKWDSTRYIETESRYLIYDTWNTAMVYLLRVSGHKTAIYKRPGHEKDGKILNLDLYESYVEELFHPNAYAFVAPLED